MLAVFSKMYTQPTPWQECVSEFICFITSEASDKCQQEKRKTINGEDMLWAMSTLGFEKYVDPLKIYLTKYRESVKAEKPDKKAKRDDAAGEAMLTSYYGQPPYGGGGAGAGGGGAHDSAW